VAGSPAISRLEADRANQDLSVAFFIVFPLGFQFQDRAGISLGAPLRIPRGLTARIIGATLNPVRSVIPRKGVTFLTQKKALLRAFYRKKVKNDAFAQ
jgi:hypothetical protein